MGKIIDGKAISNELKSLVKADVQALRKQGVKVRLSVIVVGDDPASAIYVKNKEKTAAKLGIESSVERYPASTPESEVLGQIRKLNEDGKTHGILVQLPLPKNYDVGKILGAINPAKDVDGFHPINMGKMLAGEKCLMPCTPSGIIRLIESTGIDISGKDAVVVGRSNIVGKPVAMMLLHRHATVTICHSKTINLPEKVRNADILIAAIGRPEFVRGDWIRPGAVVIDVGINRVADGKVVGDVQFEVAREKAAFITPVPGGVGPMTIVMLMKNTAKAAKLFTP